MGPLIANSEANVRREPGDQTIEVIIKIDHRAVKPLAATGSRRYTVAGSVVPAGVRERVSAVVSLDLDTQTVTQPISYGAEAAPPIPVDKLALGVARPAAPGILVSIPLMFGLVLMLKPPAAPR